MNKVKVFVADDHSVVRMGLATLLGYKKDLAVVGEAEDGAKAVEGVLRVRPDVVVMDLLMPVMDGVEATRRIRAALPETHVLILTSFGTSADVSRAIAAGATGALMKDASNEDLLSAIHVVAAGGTSFSPEILQQMEEEGPMLDLTVKQRDILYSVTRGLSNGDIAVQFGISRDAVKHHLTAIFRKLGAATRSEAVAIALRKQLLKM